MTTFAVRAEVKEGFSRHARLQTAMSRGEFEQFLVSEQFQVLPRAAVKAIFETVNLNGERRMISLAGFQKYLTSGPSPALRLYVCGGGRVCVGAYQKGERVVDGYVVTLPPALRWVLSPPPSHFFYPPIPPRHELDCGPRGAFGLP